MGAMGFNFSVIKRPTEKKTDNTLHKETAIKRGLLSVVKTTDDGLFYITHENVNYDISLDSYDCTNSFDVYDTNRLHKGRVVRYGKYGTPIGNSDHYLRFLPGNHVKGHLYKNIKTMKIEFHVDNVLFDNGVEKEDRDKFYANFKTIIEYLDVKLANIRAKMYNV